MVHYTTDFGSRKFATLVKAREYAINYDFKSILAKYGVEAYGAGIAIYRHTKECPNGYFIGNAYVQKSNRTVYYEYLPVDFDKDGQPIGFGQMIDIDKQGNRKK